MARQDTLNVNAHYNKYSTTTLIKHDCKIVGETWNGIILNGGLSQDFKVFVYPSYGIGSFTPASLNPFNRNAQLSHLPQAFSLFW